MAEARAKQPQRTKQQQSPERWAEHQAQGTSFLRGAEYSTVSDLGNPLLDQPPTDVKVSDVVDHEIDPRKRAELEALGQKDAGWFSNLWAHLWASITDGGGVVVNAFADVVDEVMLGVAKLFKAA